jgi:hypothetical protein
MLHGNVPPVRPVRPFPLSAGLPAHWYTIRRRGRSMARAFSSGLRSSM